MVALALTNEARTKRTFEKPVNRRAQFVVPVDLATRRAQLQGALGVASSTSTNRLGLTNLNRWYDATNGRWISEDPIGFAAGDANIYRYVSNSPTNFIDPTGHIGKAKYSSLPRKVQNGIDAAMTGQGQEPKPFKNNRGEKLPGDGPFTEFQCRDKDEKEDDGKRIVHDEKGNKYYYTNDIHAGDNGSEAKFDEVTDVPGPR